MRLAYDRKAQMTRPADAMAHTTPSEMKRMASPNAMHLSSDALSPRCRNESFVFELHRVCLVVDARKTPVLRTNQTTRRGGISVEIGGIV